MIRIAWYAALVLTTLTILFVLWQFSTAVMLFLLSLAVAAAFRPIIETLNEHGVRKGLALAISYGLMLSVLATIFLVASESLISNLQQATDDFLRNYEQVKHDWQADQYPLLSTLSDQLPDTQALYDALTSNETNFSAKILFGAAEGTIQFLASLVIVLVLSLYWSAGQWHFERLWLSMLPVENRSRARMIWHDIESKVGAYLRREILLSVIGGICLWLGYQILGIRYAILLAFIGAFARMIPWLGPVLVIGFPLLAGSEFGWWASITAAVYTLSTLIILELTLGSKIASRQRYSSLLLVILMMALADSYGLVGAVLAPILAVTLQIMFNDLLPLYVMSTNGAPASAIANLKEKVEMIKQKAAQLKDPDSTESANLVTRLEQLADKILSVERE